tara:strand:+ start:59 stop:274 length:216 start_codon:yes stop_codon:yes gene_type:complete
VYHTKNIIKTIKNVPSDTRFYIIMIITACSVVSEYQKSKHYLENSKKRSVLGSFVINVVGLFKRLISKEKK